jgi:ureidoacrylate peracid hydrolase
VPEFPIIPEQTGMLFFDTLNIYLKPADPQRRAEIEKSGVLTRLQRIYTACRAAGIPIFYGQADHRPDYKDFAPTVADRGLPSRGADHAHLTRPPGAISGADATDIVDELKPEPGDYIIKKHRWSTFFQTHFELSLRTAGINTILVAGSAIEVGVASTMYAARDLDYNLIVLRDVCRGFSEAVENVFMDEVFPIFARVMTVEEAIAQIQAPAAR